MKTVLSLLLCGVLLFSSGCSKNPANCGKAESVVIRDDAEQKVVDTTDDCGCSRTVTDKKTGAITVGGPCI